ncbi:MAG: membrane protein insertase YidC [Bacteroidales bacterium]|nr:membrane protein insertase YidC [Candidatus Equimonas enterica]
MDKNTVTGLILIALVLFGFSYWQNQQQEEATVKTEQVKSASTTQEKKAPAAAPQQQKTVAAAANDTTGLFGAAKQGVNTPITLANDKVSIAINTKGGMPTTVALTNFKNYTDFKAGKDQATLNLLNEKDAQAYFLFETKTANINTADYYFTPEEQTDSSVTMRLADAATGAAIVIRYTLQPDNYMLNMSVSTEGMKDLFSAKTSTFTVNWQDRLRQQEKGYDFENRYSTLTYKPNADDAEHLKEQGDDLDKKVEERVDWIAFKNQYFSSVLIADEPLTDVKLSSRQLNKEQMAGYLKELSATAEASFDATGKQATDFQWYFGPNNYRLLQSMEHYRTADHDLDLQELVYLGWPLFKWINRFFTLYVFDFFARICGLPMWLVLLLITLLLRVIVYAPTRKSFMSSAKMRALKPKVDELSKKYPNQEDAMQRQQATMQLYSDYGVSPMGGCLPMLIQMPIWIAMFNFVPNAIELRQQPFLWADDLSAYDDVINWGTNIWGIGDHLSLFCLLFCASNILYSVMTMRQQRDQMSSEQAQQMKMMQWMMYLMPLMFFFMFNTYSAGLNYYYFISLLFSALTMWYLRATTDNDKILARLEENYRANKSNPNKKARGLAARLQALQEQQERMKQMQEKQQRK